MSKEVKKITEEQLEKLTGQQTRLADMLKNIGALEIQKQNLAQQVKDLADEIEDSKVELEKEYGAINIDLRTGEYTEIEKKEEECKDCDEKEKDAK
jgi:phosphate uptake regulator